MGPPCKYPRELRERAVRMVVELRSDYPSGYAAMTATAQTLGIGSPEMIRTWIRRNQVDVGERPGVTTEAAEEFKRLKRENAELRRANEILEAASALFAAELDRPHLLVTFIEQHTDRRESGLRWGVESICAVLTQHGVKIAPSSYDDARGRGPSPREVSGERWKPIILATWERQRKILGARKFWRRLSRDGRDIARCTVERLMRDLGIAGVVRGKRKRPVDTDLRETRPVDLVDSLGLRTTPTPAASTRRSRSRIGSSTRASTRRLAASATPTTTHSRSRRSGSTSPN